MSHLRSALGALAAVALLAGGAAGCTVPKTDSSSTAAPSPNTTAAGNEKVDKNRLPDDWPAEAATPKGLAIVDVKKNASGTTVLANLKGSDAIKAGEALKAAWEKGGILVTTSSDLNDTFYMAALTKDGKTQLTATMAKGGDGPLEVILTAAPAPQ